MTTQTHKAQNAALDLLRRMGMDKKPAKLSAVTAEVSLQALQQVVAGIDTYTDVDTDIDVLPVYNIEQIYRNEYQQFETDTLINREFNFTPTYQLSFTSTHVMRVFILHAGYFGRFVINTEGFSHARYVARLTK